MKSNVWALWDTLAIIAIVIGCIVGLYEILISGIAFPLLVIILGSYSLLFLIAQLFEWRLRANSSK